MNFKEFTEQNDAKIKAKRAEIADINAAQYRYIEDQTYTGKELLDALGDGAVGLGENLESEISYALVKLFEMAIKARE